MFSLAVLFVSLLACGISTPTRHIQVDNINRFSASDHASIFESIHYPSSNEQSAEHNVHIFDAFGKFIHLTSSSQYEDHVRIFALNPNTRKDIQYIECFTDDTNTIHIKFNTKRSAFEHFQRIRKHQQRDANNRYFITGTTQWKCYNQNEEQYTPILRRINMVTLDATTDAFLLSVTTQHASYTDLFQNLHISLKSNRNIHKISGDHAMNSEPSSRRRLAWNYAGLWNNAVEGVRELWKDVGGSIDEMKGYIRDYASAHLNGSTKHFVDVLLSGDAGQQLNTTQLWTYNYNTSSKGAQNVIPITSEVDCVDCYAYANLTYAIDLQIKNYKLMYLKMIAAGGIKLNAEVQSHSAYHGEFSIRTPPELDEPIQFDIAGIIPITFTIYGEFAVAVDSETPFTQSLSTTGEIVQGVEYNGTRNEQKYIDEQSFEREVIGPILESKANYAHIYHRTTLYLKLAFVGDVYIGAKSDSAISVAEGVNEGCSIGYTPSATVTAFIGANISISGWKIWNKTDNIQVYTMPAGSSGCITHAEITALETWETAGGIAQDNDDEIPTVYIDYTAPQTAYMSSSRWGKANTIWHGDLGALNGTCLDTGAALPDSGFLMIYPVDNDGEVLHGVYRTSKHVSVEEGYPMTTNVNCIARYEFEGTKGLSNSYRYTGQMIDFDVQCDVTPRVLAVDDDWYTQFSLPGFMDAVLLDSSFNTILLHDLYDCFVFPLTKNTDLAAFAFDRTDVAKFANKSYSWPSRTWYGSFSCAQQDCVNALKLYFTDIDWLLGQVNATFLMDNNETWSARGQLYLDETLTLVLDIDRADGVVLQATGFITVLEDGTLIYSGVVPGDVGEKEYMAFVFAGYLDMDQFKASDHEERVLVREDDNVDSVDLYGLSLVAWVAIVSGSVLLLFCLIGFCVIKCIKYRKKQKESQGSMYGIMDDNYL